MWTTNDHTILNYTRQKWNNKISVVSPMLLLLLLLLLLLGSDHLEFNMKKMKATARMCRYLVIFCFCPFALLLYIFFHLIVGCRYLPPSHILAQKHTIWGIICVRAMCGGNCVLGNGVATYVLVGKEKLTLGLAWNAYKNSLQVFTDGESN